MYKTYKFRMYLTDSQKILVHKTFGCGRFVYNHFLNKCKESGYQKAYDIAIDALAILRKRNIDADWFVLGEGSLQKELTRQIAKKGL